MSTRPAKRIVVVITLLLIGSLVYWASNCNGTSGCELASLTGTWVNSDYNGLSFPKGGKIEITESDGTLHTLGYDSDTDTIPEHDDTFEYDEKWGDSECATWYHVTYVEPPDTAYGLFKINAENTTLEMQYSEVDYPSDFNVNNPWYAIYYRQ